MPPETVSPPLPLIAPKKIFADEPAELVSVWPPSVTTPLLLPTRPWMVAPALVPELSSVAMAPVVPTVTRLLPRLPPPDKAMVPALMVVLANELVPVSVRVLAPACNSVGPDMLLEIEIAWPALALLVRAIPKLTASPVTV
jgi:hypothetical protein